MEKNDIIKKKIKALLAKTTENGASESEAINALNKAKELMMEYLISEHDLADPFAFEKCVFKEIPKDKSGYNMTLFLNALSKLFDCEYFYTSTKVTFFGFEQDTELCAYFYSFIIRSCLNEKEKYLKSEEAYILKNVYHGRTLAASFIKGFIIGISDKMKKMYKDRERNLSKEVGLMVIEKKDKVFRQFEAQNLKIRKIKTDIDIKEQNAFFKGQERGNEVELVQGINSSTNKPLALCQ